MQMLKFGQVINLEAIESVSVVKGARTLPLTLTLTRTLTPTLPLALALTPTLTLAATLSLTR